MKPKPYVAKGGKEGGADLSKLKHYIGGAMGACRMCNVETCVIKKQVVQ